MQHWSVRDPIEQAQMPQKPRCELQLRNAIELEYRRSVQTCDPFAIEERLDLVRRNPFITGNTV